MKLFMKFCALGQGSTSLTDRVWRNDNFGNSSKSKEKTLGEPEFSLYGYCDDSFNKDHYFELLKNILLFYLLFFT